MLVMDQPPKSSPLRMHEVEAVMAEKKGWGQKEGWRIDTLIILIIDVMVVFCV